jgi:hypothetical protein
MSWSQPFERGKWTSWIFRTKWSLDEDGIVEVEKDGNLVFQRHGANCYNNLFAPYLKFGAYAPTWVNLSVPPEFKTREVFFTDVFARDDLPKLVKDAQLTGHSQPQPDHSVSQQ